MNEEERERLSAIVNKLIELHNSYEPAGSSLASIDALQKISFDHFSMEELIELKNRTLVEKRFTPEDLVMSLAYDIYAGSEEIREQKDLELYSKVVGLIDTTLKLGFVMTRGVEQWAHHVTKEMTVKDAASKAASKAAKARHEKNKGQKSNVMARYYELIKFDHFKNGSRAELARKIAQEPGVTVKEITISRWIKEELGG